MNIIKDSKITIELQADDDSWDEITSIDEPSVIIYEPMRPGQCNNLIKKIESQHFGAPKLFVREIEIESFPRVITNRKNIITGYEQSIKYENEYGPVGVIYVDKYKKRKPDETIYDMVNNLIEEKRLEVKKIDE